MRRNLLTGAELALVVLVYMADLEGLVPLSKTIPLLILGWISLRMRGLRWRDVGLARPPDWPRAIALGAGAGVLMELLSTFVTVPMLTGMTGAPPDLSDLRPLVGSFWLVLALTVPNWLLAAFGEEMVYRGYLMNRVADVGRGSSAAWAISLVVVSIAFGFGHEYQGLTGWIQESLAGLALGGLYLWSGRNLAVPIVAHGVANQLAFLLIYMDRYPGV